MAPVFGSLQVSTPVLISWTSLVKIPVRFLTSLFEPFTGKEVQSFYQKQIVHLKDRGVIECARSVVRVVSGKVRQHPLDTLIVTGSMVVGSANTGTVGYMVVTTAIALDRIRSFKGVVDSISHPTLLGRGLKIVAYGAAINYLFSLPLVGALKWDSLADTMASYSKRTCPDYPWKRLMNPSTECIALTKSLSKCRRLFTDETDNDVRAFTRHFTSDPNADPVSIVSLDEDKTCFYTSLKQADGVTKVCFNELNDLSSRTVERLDTMSLGRAHEGLKPGETVLYLGMTTKAGNHGCGFFYPIKLESLEEAQPVCLLTSIRSGGEVSQTCFDPQHPESVTVKEVRGIELQQPGSEPVSIIIKNPKEFGLDVNPDRMPDVPCQVESNGFSIWDAFKWWWTQKTPCDKDIRVKQEEL